MDFLIKWLLVLIGLFILPFWIYILSKAYHLGKMNAIKTVIKQEIMNYGKEEKE